MTEYDFSKVVSFSGGKDSTALILYLKEQGITHQTVFMDTGWEHTDTMEYIDYIDKKLLNGELIRLKSEGMEALVERKTRVPSAKARFCTEWLKIKPFKNWLDGQEIETIYQGIRAEESVAGAKMPSRQWVDHFDAYIERPLLFWSVKDVFEIHKRHGIDPNPLYKMGAGRVGCYPCVMITHGELKRLGEFHPEIWKRIENLEQRAGSSFFPPNYIPVRFQTGVDEKGNHFCLAKDVKKIPVRRGSRSPTNIYAGSNLYERVQPM